jgi:hypothetical protein
MKTNNSGYELGLIGIGLISFCIGMYTEWFRYKQYAVLHPCTVQVTPAPVQAYDEYIASDYPLHCFVPPIVTVKDCNKLLAWQIPICKNIIKYGVIIDITGGIRADRIKK